MASSSIPAVATTIITTALSTGEKLWNFSRAEVDAWLKSLCHTVSLSLFVRSLTNFFQDVQYTALRCYAAKDVTALASITKQQIDIKRPLYVNAMIIHSRKDDVANISTFFP